MARDMLKAIKEHEVLLKKHPRSGDVYISDARQICDLNPNESGCVCGSALFWIMDGYCAGYAVGYRTAKREGATH